MLRYKSLHAAIILMVMVGLAQAQAQSGASSPAEPDSSAQMPTGLDSLLQSIPPGELPILPDSLMDAFPDSMPRGGEGYAPGEQPIPQRSLGIHPKFKSDTRSSDLRMDISNSLDLSVSYPNTWNITGQLFYDRGLPRELKRETTEKGLSVSSSKRMIGLIPLSLSARRNRKLQEQNKGESTYRLDEWDTSSLSAQTSAGWKVNDWLGFNGNLSASANQSNSQNNRGLKRNTSDGLRNYVARVDITPHESMKLSTGYSGSRGLGSGELLDLRDQLETRRDSLNLRSTIKRGTALTLKFSGGTLESSSERLDFQRDQFNVVLPDSIPIKERTLNKDWGGNIDLDWKPAGFLDVALGFSYREGQRRVTGNEEQDKDKQSEDYNIRVGLRPWKSQVIDISYKDGESFTGQYTSDKTSRLREAQFSSKQEFSKTLKLTLDAYFFLSQDFYANSNKNPQDRDQLKNRFTVKVKGKPFSWLTAENSLAYFLNRDIMIRSSKSISNKDKTTLTWNSKLDYTFYTRFKITQNMEVKVSKDDFVFTEEQNVLDRESTLITTSSVPLYGSIRLDLGHEFKLRQLGSFLPDPPPDGPETFFLSKRVKKENFRIGISKTFLKYLKFSIKETLGREVTYYYSDGDEEKVPFGSLDTGLAYNREFGRAGTLRIDLQHQAKFGKFVREKQRSIWIPTLSIEYNF
jgi:hypothetical protein